MLKRILFPLIALFLLAGCAAPSNTLTIEPKITLPTADPTMSAITISISVPTIVSLRHLLKLTAMQSWKY